MKQTKFIKSTAYYSSTAEKPLYRLSTEVRRWPLQTVST